MNLLEQYIKEIHSVKPHIEKWTEDFPGVEFLAVDITIDCYGTIERRTEIFNADEWERIKKVGYYMA